MEILASIRRSKVVSKSNSKTNSIRIGVTKVEDDWGFVALRMNKGKRE